VKITYKLTEKDVREALGKHGGWRMRILPVIGVFQFVGGVWYLVSDPKMKAGGLALNCD
jgi:hypothetical protein